jgi:hypothetical protein
MRMREHDWMQYQNDAIGADTWEAYRRPILLALSNQRSRDWWRDISAVSYDPSFVAEVNRMIANVPVDENALKVTWYD